MAFLGLRDQINRYIMYIMQYIRLINKIFKKELGDSVVLVGWILDDISSLEG